MAIGREAFVYWRTDAGSIDAAEAAAQTWLAALRAEWPGLQARLYRRADAGTDATLMEIYALPGQALSEALLRRIVEDGHAALAPFMRGPRHVELFEPRV